jgi:ABC-type glycerol-3-phosphate transport system substrate-binding protein
MSTFKIVVIAFFSISIVVGIAVFSFAKNSGQTSVASADLVIWGTISPDAFTRALIGSSFAANKNIRMSYQRIDTADFDKKFVESLAEGTGPDIVILRDDLIYKNRNKIYPIPPKVYAERDFKEKFVEEGEIFLSPEGILAFPFIIDPMVMYWNRDIFSSNFIANPPKFWDELPDLVTKIVKKDNQANISQSLVSFGEWRNVSHAKEILTMLMLQAGTPITQYESRGLKSVLNLQFGYPRQPSQSALEFYIQFSNPNSLSYTWNRSLPTSLNFFLSGNLAVYLGFASELKGIQQKGPNLNYDVTSIPQIRDAKRKTVFGHVYGLSIVKQSKNASAAFIALTALTESPALKKMEEFTELPPVRRDMLSVRPASSHMQVFYDSALISRSWVDPEPEESSRIFKEMVESITSGKSRVSDSLIRTESEISGLIKK